jgi:butyrate kinase
MRLLAINPGSTSTKIAVFEDLEELFTLTIRHGVQELAPFARIIDQYEYRKDIIIATLNNAGFKLSDFQAIVGRGGLLKPIPGGVYRVNDLLIEDLKKEIMGEHASTLGGILAKEIAESIDGGIESFIVDPVVVDELEDIARFSGHPEVPRVSIFHALNQKAVARRFAREHKRKYEELDLIVAHLGGGVTVGVHKHGRVIDVNNGLDGDGPFSPERSGGLPSGSLAKLCYSQRYELREVRKMITGSGGIVAYLGTNNMFEVEKKVANRDKKATLVYEAMIYQICKEIGACATVLKGKIDSIIITGGLARSEMVVSKITDRVSFLGEISVYPGEDEMQALAEGAFYASIGEIPIKEYV